MAPDRGRARPLGEPRTEGREDTWTVAFEGYDPDDERRREAVMALGNGVWVARASPCWAGPSETHDPAVYRAGLYGALESEIAGERVRQESLVALPNPFALTWRAPGEGAWFAPEAARILEHAHRLDLRAGLGVRDTRLRDGRGRTLRVCEERLVSMAAPRLAAQRVTLAPEGWAGRLELRAGIDGAVRNENVPCYAPYAGDHLTAHRPTGEGRTVRLDAGLRGSDRSVSVAARLHAPAGALDAVEREPRRAWLRGAADLAPGRPLVVETAAALDVSEGGGRADARPCLSNAPGFEALRAAHARAWAELWEFFAVELDPPEDERALRFHAFHLLQTLSPHTAALDVGVPARGWHGEGYRGHVFWDEAFALPVLATRAPEIARGALLHRHRRLEAARRAAREAGLGGAMIPWRSAETGEETTPRHQLNLLTGRWMPDHTQLQRHVGAAVALDARTYADASGDAAFLAGPGAEIVCEVARFFASLACEGLDGRWDIRGVLGPDEYHTGYPGAEAPGLDTNAYTNVLASWTLAEAVRTLEELPRADRDALSARIGLDRGEPALWDRVSRRLRLAWHEAEGGPVVSQFAGYGDLAPPSAIDLPERLSGERLDWALDAVGDTTNAYQATKQADLLAAFHLLGHRAPEAFGRLGVEVTPALLRRTLDHYLARTVHESSLSCIVYAGAMAEVDPDAAWRMFREALGTDLRALRGESTAEGIHLGAMAGTLDVLQRRFLGLAVERCGLRVEPRLPKDLGFVRLRLLVRGATLEAVASRSVRLRHLGGPLLRVRANGAVFMLEAGGEVVAR